MFYVQLTCRRIHSPGFDNDIVANHDLESHYTLLASNGYAHFCIHMSFKSHALIALSPQNLFAVEYIWFLSHIFLARHCKILGMEWNELRAKIWMTLLCIFQPLKCGISYMKVVQYYRAVGAGPAGLVAAGSIFSQLTRVKMLYEAGCSIVPLKLGWQLSSARFSVGAEGKQTL